MPRPKDPGSLRSIGERLGISPEAVRKAKAAGRIAVDETDPDAAARQLAARTDPGRNRGRRRARALEPSPEVGHGPAGDADGEAGPALRLDEARRKLDAGEAMTFLEARTANEVLKARAVALRLDEAEGRLLPAEEVRAVREAENRALRDRLRAVPVAVAGRVLDAAAKGARAPEVAGLLLAEIDAALEDLAGVAAAATPGADRRG